MYRDSFIHTKMPRKTQQVQQTLSQKQLTTPSPKKKNMGKVIVMGGDRFWERMFEGKPIIVRCFDNIAFDITTGMGVGTWDEDKATVLDD